MSSHHIVREKQEPALLVLSVDGFPDEWLGQLLEWSPTLMVTAGTAEKINMLGIKYDVLIAPATNGTDNQANIKNIVPGVDTDLQAALKYLTANNYPAVNVVTDQLSLSDYLPHLSNINIVIFHRQQKIYSIKSGFSKWKAAGELIEFKSQPTTLQLAGLELTNGSIYKTIADGFFTIKFHDDCIFIAENLV